MLPGLRASRDLPRRHSRPDAGTDCLLFTSVRFRYPRLCSRRHRCVDLHAVYGNCRVFRVQCRGELLLPSQLHPLPADNLPCDLVTITHMQVSWFN